MFHEDPLTYAAELKRLAAGDPAALEYFYVQYAGKVQAFAQKLIGNREEAEDLTHNIFLTLWNERDKVMNINSMEAYLFRMARNAVINRLRAIDYRRISELTADIPVADESEEDAYRNYSGLMQAIEKLPAMQALILRSRINGMGYKEISDMLNISPHTVHYHISRALRALRKTLGNPNFLLILTLYKTLQ